MSADPWARFHDAADRLAGWWEPDLCRVLRAINDLHATYGLAGWIVEFGVFRGRSLAALALMAGEHDRLLGIDRFDVSDYNAARTGSQPSRDAAQQALDMVGVPADRVALVEMDLSQLDALGLESLLNRLGGYQPIRVAHIDAGHEFRQTSQDLDTIAPHLDALGALLLDDVFHHQWPEVSLAFAQFLRTHAGWNVIGCFHARVLIVRQDAAQLYYEALTRLLGRPWQTFLGRPYFTLP